ncbi:MAG: MarC family protein [Desertifilum sp. SIO1I2]|nr:MarC family protein [Desertifilum sp. SIO1I2]
MAMQPFFEFFLGSFAALFPVVDPLGGVPVFLVLTSATSSGFRNQLAWKIALYTVSLLVLFLLVGGGFLRFFGISLEVVRIAGGIVVFHAGWHTMNADPKLTPEDSAEATSKTTNQEDISFVPMTIPMLAGPGSIAVTLGLAAQAGRNFATETYIRLFGAAIAIGVVGLTVYLCLRSSNLLLSWLGETGIRAFSRILGLFILAIGVQLILNGFADWLADLGLVTLPERAGISLL